MAGFLDVNFDSDEDFEETAGRGGGGPAGRGNGGRGRGEGGRGVRGGRGGGVGVGRGVGGGGDRAVAVIEGLSQVAEPSRAVEGRGAGQVGRGRGGVGGQGGAGGRGDRVAADRQQEGGPGSGGRGRGAGGRGGGAAARGRGQGGRRAKFRNWCFTINNYTGVPDADFLRGPPPIKYLCYGREVSTTGTPHLQGYVTFENAVARPAQLFARFGQGHFTPAYGTADQNAEYCAKEGDFAEFGQRPQNQRDQGHHGARHGWRGGSAGVIGGEMEIERWARTWDLAKEGRIEEVPADIRVRHYNTITKIASRYQKPPPKLPKLDNLWIVGPAGTGKSTYVHSKYPGAFKKSFSKWWCGYRPDDEGHSVVILDDLHFKWADKEMLKNWADVFSFVAETKGGSMQIRPKQIIVTSNYTIEQVKSFSCK